MSTKEKRKVIPFNKVESSSSDLRTLDLKKVKLPREVLEGLMTGSISRIHLYDFNNILRPRGHMKKESIGETILEKLKVYYESWTDPSYSDILDKTIVLETLQKNLKEECDGAWKEFLHFINEKDKTIGT